MARYSFDLSEKEMLDNIRSPQVYQYNLAKNMALLSNEPTVIRQFYQVTIARYFKNMWINMQGTDTFLGSYVPGQAFAYFGLIPMIVSAKVNLLTSAGFNCKSDDKLLDEALNKIKKEANLEQKFSEGAYWESGLGDFAYRISYNPKAKSKPIIKTIEPQHLEVNYLNGEVKSFVIKEVSDDKPNYELHEIHSLTEDGFAKITYRYYKDKKYVAPNDEYLNAECNEVFDHKINLKDTILPIKGFLVIFKKNANNNQLYKGERGVPDIQGLDTIEDALSESISDLIDAIRKGGTKVFIDDSLIPQDEKGNDLRINPFNKTIITTKGSANPMDNKSLWNVVSADIKWESYIKTIQTLMSTGINKAGLSPTTIGLTGLESINSSAESQEAREKVSLRTRKTALDSWKITLKELFNKYLQVEDYIAGREIFDYSDLINIQFDEYNTPTIENKTETLIAQVSSGLKSRETAISELNEGAKDEVIKAEMEKIEKENQPAQEEQEEIPVLEGV